MGKRTCFVVSRIGEEGGPIRQHADDVFDLLIQPALEKFGIEAVRADHIAGTGSITNDVVRQVQDSDLCIIDLTGKNPNVYYECGRRHETGKPFIQIIAKDEEIPFDIADIRTIKYELKDPREVRNAALKIQSFVEEAIGQGFASTSGATTMASLLEALNRIERRLVNLESGSISTSILSSPVNDFRSLTDNPLKSFQEAYIKGDIGSIVRLLPRLELIMPANQFIMVAGVVAIQGEKLGGAAVQRTLEARYEQLESDAVKAGITSLVQYHVARSTEAEGVAEIEPVALKLLGSSDLSDDDRGYINNQLGIVCHGAGKLEDALRYSEEALRFNPTEPSYHYNISIIYQKLNLSGKAVEHVRSSLELAGDPDSDHISHAFEVFTEAGLYEEASLALGQLQKVDPARAVFLRERRRK